MHAKIKKLNEWINIKYIYSELIIVIKNIQRNIKQKWGYLY